VSRLCQTDNYIDAPISIWSYCLYRNETDVEAAANARLISAAPDLLSACRAALVSLINDEDYQKHKPLIQALENAIQKAEGR